VKSKKLAVSVGGGLNTPTRNAIQALKKTTPAPSTLTPKEGKGKTPKSAKSGKKSAAAIVDGVGDVVAASPGPNVTSPMHASAVASPKAMTPAPTASLKTMTPKATTPASTASLMAQAQAQTQTPQAITPTPTAVSRTEKTITPKATTPAPTAASKTATPKATTPAPTAAPMTATPRGMAQAPTFMSPATPMFSTPMVPSCGVEEEEEEEEEV
jgi:hypothetical protein